MALAALSGIEPLKALGIVARTALALDDDRNPAANPAFAGELPLRQAVVTELLERLRLGTDDASPETLDKLTDLLDQEADQLTGPVDEDAAIVRMSRAGTLPSDLLEPVWAGLEPVWAGFTPVPISLLFDVERDRILETVRRPDDQDHYGPPGQTDRPSFISLFAKHYDVDSDRKAYVFVVSGQRDGSKLIVRQAWRLYYSEVAVKRARSLSDLMRLFAHKYGGMFTVNGQNRNYILFERFPSSSGTLDVTLSGSHGMYIYSGVMQPYEATIEVAFAFAINMDQYLKVLGTRGAIDADTKKQILSAPDQAGIGSKFLKDISGSTVRFQFNNIGDPGACCEIENRPR